MVPFLSSEDLCNISTAYSNFKLILELILVSVNMEEPSILFERKLNGLSQFRLTCKTSAIYFKLIMGQCQGIFGPQPTENWQKLQIVKLTC
jgi:hypothetical protein